jgi:hypothetical protein
MLFAKWVQTESPKLNGQLSQENTMFVVVFLDLLLFLLSMVLGAYLCSSAFRPISLRKRNRVLLYFNHLDFIVLIIGEGNNAIYKLIGEFHH